MPETPDTKAIQDACAALSAPNQERAYAVACALKFAEDRAGKDAAAGLAGDRENRVKKPLGL